MTGQNEHMGTCLYCGEYRVMRYHLEYENCPSPVMKTYMEYRQKRRRGLRAQAARI